MAYTTEPLASAPTFQAAIARIAALEGQLDIPSALPVTTPWATQGLAQFFVNRDPSLLDFAAGTTDVGLMLNRAAAAGYYNLSMPHVGSGLTFQTPFNAGGNRMLFSGGANDIVTAGGITGITGMGPYSRIGDMRFLGPTGTGTPSAFIGVDITSYQSVIERVHAERIGVGVKHSSGFYNTIMDCFSRNIGLAPIWLYGGVGPIVRGGGCDTDGQWYGYQVASLTSANGVATLTTTVPHGYNTGETVRVGQAAQAAYNGQHVITVTGATTFTYPVTGNPASPATIIGPLGPAYMSVTSVTRGGGFDPPSKGAVYVQTEGVICTDYNGTHAGLNLETRDGQNIHFGSFANNFWDSVPNAACVTFNALSASSVFRSIKLDNESIATGVRGVDMFGTAAAFDGVQVQNSKIQNCLNEGARIMAGGANITFKANQFYNNNTYGLFGFDALSLGNANQILNNGSQVTVKASEFAGLVNHWSTTPNAHVYTQTGSTGEISGNTFDAHTATGAIQGDVSTVVVKSNVGATLGNYASDSAAANGGVAIGSQYRNGSALMERQS